MAAPDPLARPMARRDHDRELGEPRRLAGAPAHVIRNRLELAGEIRAAHVHAEGRVPERRGVVARRLLQVLDVGLLRRAELTRIERRVALLRGGGQRQCKSRRNEHCLQQMLHSFPSHMFGRLGLAAV